MKVLLITPWFSSLKPDSLESRQGVFEFRQAVEMSKRGHEYRIVTIRWRGQSAFEEIGKNIKIQRLIPFFIFPKIRYPVPNFFSLSLAIKRISKNWIPDIILYSHFEYLTAFPAIWLNKSVKISSLVSTDGLPGISWFYGNKLIDFIGRCYSKIIARNIVKSACGVQLMTHKLLQDDKALKVNFRNVFVCSRGVDTELFKPAADRTALRESQGFSEKDILVLYVGRLDMVKGVEYLIKAAKMIIPKNENVKLLLVGDGTLRCQYEKLTENYKGKIIFTGWRDDIPQIMRMSDIFILPSLTEGAPNVLLEAGATGLPVIATDVGGTSQIIKDGETGILIKPRDVDSLFNTLIRLIEDKALIKKMGQASRSRVVQFYNWDYICKVLENEYRKLIVKYK